MTRVAVIGGGAWGTTLADLLARKGEDVTLWVREPEVAAQISREHLNGIFLSGCPLAPSLAATVDLRTAMKDAEVVVSAAPSHAVKSVMSEALAGLPRMPAIVSVSKGLEPERLVTLSCLLGELSRGAAVAVLSGPTFALEVYRRQPTAAVVAARDHDLARRIQALFATGTFRVYTHGDVTGVELGGALKNVIAVAAGMVDGLGFGFNTRAALITRGLAEITRLGLALGAEPMTFAGLAGLGDLILTATGSLSRNHSLGVELGKGKTLAEALAGKQSVAEGIGTARTAVALGERHQVDLPIARQVAAILFEGKTARQAMVELMEREPKPEQWR